MSYKVFTRDDIIEVSNKNNTRIEVYSIDSILSKWKDHSNTSLFEDYLLRYLLKNKCSVFSAIRRLEDEVMFEL